MKSTRSDWLIPTGLVALSLVPAVAGIARLTQLGGGSTITPENARFFASPLPVLIHIPAVIIYSLLGAFQFAPGFRIRHRAWHRAAGRILVPCALLVALSGLWMAQFYPWPQGDGQGVYIERLIVGVAMLLFIIISLNALRQRNFASHGTWMMRAYAIAMGAGTQVFTHLVWFATVGGKPGETTRAILMGAGWVINVVVVESIIRNARRRRKPLSVAPARVFETA